MKNRTQKLAFSGLAVAMALALSYVEMLLPPIWAAVPGIKMGLPNIIIIFLLYRYNVKYAAAVSLVRIGLAVLLFGNIMTLWYSLAGAVLSLGIMVLLQKTKAFSMVAVSIAGGVFHNLGQIIVAILVMQTTEIGYYMIILAVTGTVAGIFVGIAGMLLIKYVRKLKI